MYLWLNLFITLPLFIITCIAWISKSRRPYATQRIERIRTNLDVLIDQYKARDVADTTSTIDFLLKADKLKNPFDAASILPPPKPSDAAYSARPVQYHQSCCKCAMCVYEMKKQYIKNNPPLDFFPIGHPALSKPPEPF